MRKKQIRPICFHMRFGSVECDHVCVSTSLFRVPNEKKSQINDEIFKVVKNWIQNMPLTDL